MANNNDIIAPQTISMYEHEEEVYRMEREGINNINTGKQDSLNEIKD